MITCRGHVTRASIRASRNRKATSNNREVGKGGKVMNEREILDQLIIEKKITEEEIAEASNRVLTIEAKDLIDMLHNRLCNLNHDLGECRWYDEFGADTWTRPFHLGWAKSFKDFLASTKLIKFIPESVTEEPSSDTDGSSLPS